jgi:orotate phosphoribosyltransferase-like protein
MKQVDLLNKALVLRKQGYSLKQISEQLNISKSTASVWMRDVVMNRKAQKKLRNHCDKGRQKGAEAGRVKRLQRIKDIEVRTMSFIQNLESLSVDQCKLLLAMMYWGEGSKTGNRLMFTNSDPNFVKAYLFLLRKSFIINENRLYIALHIHDYHDKTEMIDFWSKLTKISKNHFCVYKKSNIGKVKKINYKGCVSVRYGDVNVSDEVMIIIERFSKAIE